MSENISLSVVIPVFNVEMYLERCLKSLTDAEGISDAEIILINDGSSDGSVKIAEKYCDLFANIRLINTKNQGPSSARNLGLKEAKGNYVFFCDSDDEVVPERFSEVIKMIPDSDADMILWDAELTDKDGNLFTGKEQNDYIHSAIVQTSDLITGKQLFETELSYKRTFPATVWMGVYSRDYLIKNDLFFETGVMHEDELWVPQVVLSAQKIRCIPVTVYRYRIREGSLTNPAFEDRSLSAASMVKIYPELFRALESILKDDPFLEKVEAVFAQRYLYMIYKYRIWRYGYGKDIDKKMLWRTSRRFKDKLKVLGLYVVAG